MVLLTRGAIAIYVLLARGAIAISLDARYDTFPIQGRWIPFERRIRLRHL